LPTLGVPERSAWAKLMSVADLAVPERDMNARPLIMLIDDDELLSAAVNRLLTSQGFDVYMSGTGFGMIQAVLKLKPDAIVLDMVMPALDGQRCATLIRERFGGDIPIVLWSGSDESVMKLAASGFANTCFVAKAGGAGSLCDALRSRLAEARRPRALEEPPERLPRGGGFMDESIRSLFTPFDLKTLENDASPICAAGPDLRIVFVNRAWTEFGRANEGRAGDEGRGVGANLVGVSPAILRPFYGELFHRAQQLSTPVHWHYECSSPATLRHYRMRVAPCASGALVVSHSLVGEAPAPADRLDAPDAFYRDGRGLLVQCANCRRVRRADSSPRWEWVVAFVARMPPATSHGLCPICLRNYYPPGIPTSSSWIATRAR
jgi:CheY-like chemotaxis protein